MLKKVALAVAAAFVAQAASASSIDFHGYMRAGIGTTDKGGNQQCFEDAYPASAKYRLGNECDNYAELAFDTKLYKGTDGVWSNYHVRFGMRDGGAQNFQSSGSMGTQSPGESNPYYFQATPAMMQWSQREDYVDFGGFADSGPLKNAKIWLGNRFDNRNDVHINDYYYWDNSGEGVGIEGIELGPIKAAFNIVQQGTSSGLDGAPAAPDFSEMTTFNQITLTKGTQQSWGVSGGAYEYQIVTGHRFQIRLYDIPLWKNGKLETAFQYIKGDGIDVYSSQPAQNVPGGSSISQGILANNSGWTQWGGYQNSNRDPANSHGALYTIQWQQSNVLGGFNKFAFQIGTGAAAGGNWVPAYAHLINVPSGELTRRMVEQFQISPVKHFDLFGDLIYQENMHAAGYGNTNPNNPDTWVSIGFRPVVNFTNNVSLAMELSQDLSRNPGNGGNNNDNMQKLDKFTIAPQLAAGAGFWARPVFRVFYTHAYWNNNAAGAVNAFSNNVWYGQTTGNTYGAQVEAWW